MRLLTSPTAGRSGAGVVGRGCPEVDAGNATGDAVDVDVLGVTGRLGHDHDVVLLRRAHVDVAEPDHRAGGRGAEHTALSPPGCDHREADRRSALLRLDARHVDARPQFGVERRYRICVGSFGHRHRIREVGERCVAAPGDRLRTATVVPR
jgi:hypothetical protein